MNNNASIDWKPVQVEPMPEMRKVTARAAITAAPTPPASAQPERDWELSCDHCNGSGQVFVKHPVAERKTDVQEFKEQCEACDGRGFNIAFEDIPGIAEYVKSCRPASTVADESAKNERARGPVDVLEIAREIGLRSYLHGVNAMEARVILQRFVDALPAAPAPAAGDALPPLDDDLIEILGRPNFACAELATLLRAGGHSIKNKAEHEQAAVIHFLLGHYLKHGAAWHEHAGAAFEAIAQQAQRKEA